MAGLRKERMKTSSSSSESASNANGSYSSNRNEEKSESSSPSSSSVPTQINVYNDPSVFPSSTRYQLHLLAHSSGLDSHLSQRLKQILASQLYACNSAQEQLYSYFIRIVREKVKPEIEKKHQLHLHKQHQEFISKLTPSSSSFSSSSSSSSSSASSSSSSSSSSSLLLRQSTDQYKYLQSLCSYYDDEELYDLLFHYYHETICLLPEVVKQKQKKSDSGEDGRANSRVNEIVSLIRECRSEPITSLLDIGCSEGAITAPLGAALSLPPSSIHGCDVRELPALQSTGFSFTLIQNTSPSVLPYASSSFDCICFLMSLHHIESLSSMLVEAKRCLRVGGLLLIREHDCSVNRLSMLLDVMHGLYARVWSKPAEQPSFCDTYYAHYRKREEWNHILTTGRMKEGEEGEGGRGRGEGTTAPDHDSSGPVVDPLMNGLGLIQCNRSPDRDSLYRSPIPPERYRPGSYIKNPFQFYYGVYRKAEEKEEKSTRDAARLVGSRGPPSSNSTRSNWGKQPYKRSRDGETEDGGETVKRGRTDTGAGHD